MVDTLSESRFQMWRAVVAMAHADGIVTAHEVHFLNESAKSLPLSPEQHQTLLADFQTENDIGGLFITIVDPKDRLDFFRLARVMCWSDGDFGEQEKRIMSALETIYDEAEHKRLLEDSRAGFSEISLNGDIWMDIIRQKGITGFLNEAGA